MRFPSAAQCGLCDVIEFLNCAHVRSQSAACPHWARERFGLSAIYMKLGSTSTLEAVDILWPVKFGELGAGIS